MVLIGESFFTSQANSAIVSTLSLTIWRSAPCWIATAIAPGIGFAVGDAGHGVTHRRAAALGGDDAGDVGAFLLEVAFGEGNAERHAVRGGAVIADGNVFRLRRTDGGDSQGKS